MTVINVFKFPLHRTDIGGEKYLITILIVIINERKKKKKNIIKFYISYIHWSSSLLFLLLVYRFELRLKQTNKPFSIMIFNWFYNKMTILINLTFEKQQDTAFFLANRNVGDTINFVYTRCDNRTWEFFDVNDNTSTSRMAII